jgi:hypothetical protein
VIFYVYLWLRYDGSPYYVGKGKKKRAFVHFNHSVSPPRDPGRILVQSCSSEQEAYEIEKFFIAFYGRKDIGTGILQNRTIGGDGGDTRAGRKHTPETREKMRQAQLGKKRPYMAERNRQPWARAASSCPKPKSDEMKARLSAARTGKHYPKLSEALHRLARPRNSKNGRFLSNEEISSLVS